MDHISDMQAFIAPANEGFKEIIKRFKLKPKQDLPKDESKAPSHASPKPIDMPAVTRMDDVIDRLQIFFGMCARQGITDIEAYGVFGDQNMSTFFFKQNGSGWKYDGSGNLSMTIYTIFNQMRKCKDIPGGSQLASYRAHFHDSQVGFSLSFDKVNDPAEEITKMMRKYMNLTGNASAAFYAHGNESVTVAFTHCEENDYAVAIEAITKTGKRINQIAGGNYRTGDRSAMIDELINLLVKNGVKFASQRDAERNFRGQSMGQAFAMAYAAGFGVGKSYTVYSNGTITYACEPNKAECSNVMLLLINKNGKNRALNVSIRTIAKMYNDDLSGIDPTKVKKYAKYLIKYFNEGTSEAATSVSYDAASNE